MTRPDTPPSYLFIGDSVTWQPSGWADMVCETTNASKDNLAVAGCVARDAMSSQIPAPSATYDVGLVYIGTNDVIRREDLEQFEQAVTIIATRVLACSGRCVLLTVPLSLFPYRWGIRARIRIVNTALRRIARALRCEIVEMENVPVAQFWLPDRVHPSRAGHAIIANRVLARIGQDRRVTVVGEHQLRWQRSLAIGLRQPVRALRRLAGFGSARPAPPTGRELG